MITIFLCIYHFLLLRYSPVAIHGAYCFGGKKHGEQTCREKMRLFRGVTDLLC